MLTRMQGVFRLSRWGRGRQIIWPALGIALATFIPCGQVIGAEFRTRLPIRTAEPLPPGAEAVKTITPVDPGTVERVVTKLFNAYNTDPATLESMFAEGLRDRARLLDTMSERLPRDAKLTVLSIQSAITLDQMIQESPSTGRKKRVSMVSVIVRSQLEFNDPLQGFQRLEGTNEYQLSVEEPLENP